MAVKITVTAPLKIELGAQFDADTVVKYLTYARSNMPPGPTPEEGVVLTDVINGLNNAPKID
jgi:hypothetical protein